MVCLLPATAFAQAPQTLLKDKAVIHFTGSFLRYDRVFNKTGDLIDSRSSIQDNTFTASVVYGITDKFTIKAGLPFKVQYTTPDATDQRSGNLDGLSNVALGGQYLFWNKELKITAGLDVLSRNYSVNYTSSLRTGYVGYTVMPYVFIVKQYDRKYITAQAGFAARSNKYSEEIRVNIEGGYKFFNKLWLAGLIDSKFSLRNGSFHEHDSPGFFSTGMSVNNQQFFSAGGKATYAFTEAFGIQATVMVPLSGRNIAASPLTEGGLYLKF